MRAFNAIAAYARFRDSADGGYGKR